MSENSMLHVATSPCNSLMISSHMHSVTVHIQVLSQTYLGKMETQRVNKKKRMDVVSRHHRVSVHAKQNRMNAYLSVLGEHVTNKGQSHRAGGTAVLPRKERSRGKAKQDR